MKISDEHLPGLYQAADRTSLKAQKIHFLGLVVYLSLLVVASIVSFFDDSSPGNALLSAALFFITLLILILLQVKRPQDIWYNGRAVAESVKTRAWRWMMRAEPYFDCDNKDIVSKQFIEDLREIFNQNRSLANALDADVSTIDPISSCMNELRALSVQERLDIYKSERIQDQADWYGRKSILNRKKSSKWFLVSVTLHAVTIIMLLYRIKDPSISLPLGAITTAVSAVLTWLQAKKYNELASSYSLTAHEIALIKGMGLAISNEKELSDFVVNSEAAFSREHTQWFARKNE